jgi:hypothetical protein
MAMDTSKIDRKEAPRLKDTHDQVQGLTPGMLKQAEETGTDPQFYAGLPDAPKTDNLIDLDQWEKDHSIAASVLAADKELYLSHKDNLKPVADLETRLKAIGLKPPAEKMGFGESTLLSTWEGMKNSVRYLVDLGAGVSDFFAEVAEWQKAQGLPELHYPGLRDLQIEANKEVQSFANKVTGEIIPPDVEFHKRRDKANWYVKYPGEVVEQIPTVATQVAAHVVGGPGLSVTLMFAHIAGGTYGNLRKAHPNEKPSRLLALAFTNALLQAPLERIGVSRLTKFLKTDRAFTKRVAEWMAGLASEGITEFTQAVPEDIIKKVAADPELERDFYKLITTIGKTVTSKEFLKYATHKALLVTFAHGAVNSPQLLRTGRSGVPPDSITARVPKALRRASGQSNVSKDNPEADAGEQAKPSSGRFVGKVPPPPKPAYPVPPYSEALGQANQQLTEKMGGPGFLNRQQLTGPAPALDPRDNATTEVLRALKRTSGQSKVSKENPEAFDRASQQVIEKMGGPQSVLIRARELQAVLDEAVETGALDPVDLPQTLKLAGIDSIQLDKGVIKDDYLRIETAKTHHLTGLFKGIGNLFRYKVPAPPILEELDRELNELPLPEIGMERIRQQAESAGLIPEAARVGAVIAGREARMLAAIKGVDPEEFLEQRISGIVGPDWRPSRPQPPRFESYDAALKASPPWLKNALTEHREALDGVSQEDMHGAIELVLAAEQSPFGVERTRGYITRLAMPAPGEKSIYSPVARKVAIALSENDPGVLSAPQIDPAQLNQPMNPDVDLDAPVEIVWGQPQLTSRPPHEWRKGQGRRELKERLAGTYPNRETGWDIELSGNNVSHALGNAVGSKIDLSIALEAVANLPGLIKRATLVESVPPIESEPDVNRVHRFFAAFGFDGKPYVVRITVKEYSSRRQATLTEVYRAYDARAEKEVPGGPQQLPKGSLPSGTAHTPSTTIKLRHLLVGVKDSNNDLYLPPADTSSRAFKDWFGDSVIVNENGDPQIVYHGTSADIDEFKPRTARSIWFAPDPGYAGKYVSQNPEAANSIYPVYLKVETPLIIDMQGGENLPSNLGGTLDYANTIEDAAGIARQQGYDGLIIMNRAKTVEGFSSDEIAVFSPNQVKSVNNLGAWDPDNPHILHQDSRGVTYFNPDTGQAIIKILKDGDPTTLVHELAHIFRRDMRDLALDPNTPEWFKRDNQAVEHFVGAKPGEAWSVEQEEKFAKGFEKYLAEGKAPAPELRGVFARLRKWMMDVYRSLKQMYPGVQINDDIRGVFDRLLATDREIIAARAQADLHPMLDKADVPQGEWESYQNLAEQARNKAAENALKHRGKVYKKELAKWRKQARRLANDHPGQKLIDRVMETGGLSSELLNDVADKETIRALSKKRVGLVKRNGAPPYEAAAGLGMTEIELIEAIMRSPTKKELITAHLQRQNLAFQSELEPIEHAVSKEHEALLAAEGEYLAKAGGEAFIPPVEDILTPDQAIGDIEQQDIPDLINDYRRVARLTAKAYKAGKKDQAARAKAAQLDKARRLREVSRARREIKEIKSRLARKARLKEQAPEKFSGIHIDHLYQMRGLLNRYAALPKGIQYREDLAGWLKSMQMEYCPDLDDALVNQTGEWNPRIIASRAASKKDGSPRKRPFKHWISALTLDQLRTLDEAFTILETTGREQKKFVAGEIKRDMDEVVAELITSIRKAFPKKFQGVDIEKDPGEVTGQTPWQTAKAGFKSGAALLETPENNIRWMDQYEENGAAHRLLFQTAEAGLQVKEDIKRRAIDNLADLVNALPSTKGWNKLTTVPGLKSPTTRWKLIGMALNTGNPGNQEALVWGNRLYESSEVKDGKIPGLETRKVLAVREALSDEELALVQGIWDLLETLKPGLFKAYYDQYGVFPKEVEAKAFTVRGKTYRGGYYPIVHDTRQSQRQEAFAMQDDAKAYSSPSQWMGLKRSATYERKGSRSALRLDMGVLLNHIDEVAHYTALAGPLRSIHKVLSDEQMAAVVQMAIGDARHKDLLQWTKDVARPRRMMEHALESWMRAANNNMSVVMLAFNLTTVLKQWLGFPLVFTGKNRVTFKHYAEALAIASRNPFKTAKLVTELSPFMRGRAGNLDREYAEMTEHADIGKSGKLAQAARAGMKPISWMDGIMMTPVWLAKYNQKMAETKGDQKRAVAAADQVLRGTQGSGRMIDRPGIQRKQNEFLRTLTLFTTATNAIYNLQLEHVRTLRQRGWTPRAIASYIYATTLSLLIPAVLNGFMDDREKWEPKDLVMDAILAPFEVVPGFRDMAAGIKGYTYRGGSIGTQLHGFNAMVNSLKAAEPNYLRAAEKGLGLVAIAPLQAWGMPAYRGLPANALITAERGLRDMAERDTGPLGPGHVFIRRRER